MKDGTMSRISRQRNGIPERDPIRTIPDKKFVSFTTISRMYDECAIQRFDYLHRFFYTWYWTSSALVIVLSTISGAVSAPSMLASTDEAVNGVLSAIGVTAGILAATILSIEKIVNVQTISNDCRWARGELAYYLADRSEMPARMFNRINNINLLCFQHPRRCDI